MRYVGGKERLGKWVAEHLLSLQDGRSHYLEPFVGSGAVFSRVAPHFKAATAADAHLDLILMWQAIAQGWNPPEHVTKEEYASLKHAEPSALRGIVGFGASFGGKWFGGYVDTVWDAHWQRYTKPYLRAARASVLKMRSVFAAAKIRHASYEQHHPGPDSFVYCDPPYAKVLSYGGTLPFDSTKFWSVMDQWIAKGALVVVSESEAPPHWKVLAERERKAMLRVAKGGENKKRREALFWRGDLLNGAAT